MFSYATHWLVSAKDVTTFCIGAASTNTSNKLFIETSISYTSVTQKEREKKKRSIQTNTQKDHIHAKCSPLFPLTHKDVCVPGLPSQLLLSFSVLRNGRKVLNCDKNSADISCLHGIRVLSITWVVLGHSFTAFYSVQGETVLFGFSSTLVCLLPKTVVASLVKASPRGRKITGSNPACAGNFHLSHMWTERGGT